MGGGGGAQRGLLLLLLPIPPSGATTTTFPFPQLLCALTSPPLSQSSFLGLLSRRRRRLSWRERGREGEAV